MLEPAIRLPQTLVFCISTKDFIIQRIAMYQILVILVQFQMVPAQMLITQLCLEIVISIDILQTQVRHLKQTLD